MRTALDAIADEAQTIRANARNGVSARFMTLSFGGCGSRAADEAESAGLLDPYRRLRAAELRALVPRHDALRRRGGRPPRTGGPHGIARWQALMCGSQRKGMGKRGCTQ